MKSEIESSTSGVENNGPLIQDSPSLKNGTGNADEKKDTSSSVFTLNEVAVIIKQRSYLLLIACICTILYLLTLDSIFSSFRVGGVIQFIGQLSESVIVPHRIIIIIGVILNAAAWYLKNKKLSIASLITYVIGVLFFTNSFIYMLLTIILLIISLLMPMKKSA